ncbi:unnamed protein product [Prorocentrum cordatum]|uniref:Uncharacterized protein n=1 Tax=Prorocentrum cordatum TaxID=2364126 RepID=A0ABN9TQV4_9DINO|nr:unnamed protein product [Polarella glacialis]
MTSVGSWTTPVSGTRARRRSLQRLARRSHMALGGAARRRRGGRLPPGVGPRRAAPARALPAAADPRGAGRRGRGRGGPRARGQPHPAPGGQLSLAPGWRCDEDPYMELPPAEAAARLASWPGGPACFWNCSGGPPARTIEVAVDGEGVVSLADDAGCGKSAVTRVGMPLRVAVGCRVAGRPGPGAEFPHAGSGRQHRPCPPERPALFDWFEVRARRSELDPGLQPRLLEGGSVLPMLRWAGEGLLSRLR